MFDQIENARMTELKRRPSLPPKPGPSAVVNGVLTTLNESQVNNNTDKSTSPDGSRPQVAANKAVGADVKSVNYSANSSAWDDDWDDVFTKISLKSENSANKAVVNGGSDRVAVDVLAFPGKQSFSQPFVKSTSSDPFASLSASFSSRPRTESAASTPKKSDEFDFTDTAGSESVFRASSKYGQASGNSSSSLL